MVLLGTALFVHVLILVHFARKMWFIGDDWDFLLTRGTVPGASLGWMTPHNDHWNTGSIVIIRALFTVFGLDHYLPYALVPILMHVVICVALLLILRRAGADPWGSVAATLLVAFLGAGAEALLTVSSMSLTGALMFGVLAVYALVREDLSRRSIVVAWALLVAALTFSGAGLTSLALVTVFTALRRGWLAGLQVLSLPALVFLVWYLTVGHANATPAADDKWVYLQVPAYVWTGLTGALSSAAGIPGSGALVLAGLVAGVVLASKSSPVLRQLAWAGVAAAVCQLALAGTTRIGFGLETASAGRYTFIVLVLLSPAIAICVGVLVDALVVRTWMVAALGAVVLLGYTVNAVRIEMEFQRFWSEPSRSAQSLVPGLIAGADADQRILTDKTGNWLDGIDPKLIVSPQIRAAVGDKATPQQRLDAEGTYFVGVGPQEFGLFAPGAAELTEGFAGEVITAPGCLTHNTISDAPEITLASSSGNEIGVKSNSSSIVTRVRRGGLTSAPRTWAVTPGVPVHVATSAKDAELLMTFDSSGEYLVCKN